MHKSKPKVSIIIPVYNGSNYLSEAIDSALAQSYRNIEIIVVNDGSTDRGATERVAKSYGDKITYYRKKNGGVATALNYGIRKMTGEYFSWLSHDDKYTEDRVSAMVDRLPTEPILLENTIIATSFSVFDDSGVIYSISPKSNKHEFTHPLSYLFKGYLNGCALLIPRNILIVSGLFNEMLPTTQDYDMWFRLLSKYNLIFIDKFLTLSRSHSGQGSKTMINEHIRECDSLWIGMSKKLSNDQKINVFGSELAFYNEIYVFLDNNTSYKRAIEYFKLKKTSAYARAILLQTEKDYVNKIGIIDLESSIINIIKSSKKTLLFPIYGDYNDRGGLNKMISKLINNLSFKYNIILTSYTPNIEGYDLSKEVSYIRLFDDRNIVENIKFLVDTFSVDIIIVSHNCSLAGLKTLSNISNYKTKTIAWNHEDYFLPYYKPELFDTVNYRNQTFTQIDAVVWLTHSSSMAYSLYGNNGVVIPNFINNLENRYYKSTAPKTWKNMIAIARFDDPRKRIELLVRMYELLLKKRSDITLTILGYVDLKYKYSNNETIGQAIRRINKHKKMIYLSGIVRDPSEYYKRADLNILPSRFEGFGLTILESASLGVPSVVFDNSGFRDIIESDVNGLIIEEGKTDIMAEVINELYIDEAKLNSMKIKTNDIVSKFSKDNVLLQWEVLLEKLLNDEKVEFIKDILTQQDLLKMLVNYEDCAENISKELVRIKHTLFNELNFSTHQTSEIKKLKDLVRQLSVQTAGAKASFISGWPTVIKLAYYYLKDRLIKVFIDCGPMYGFWVIVRKTARVAYTSIANNHLSSIRLLARSLNIYGLTETNRRLKIKILRRIGVYSE